MDVVKKIYQYAEPNLSLVGWMGFLGFPAYYFVWSYAYPQPYENAALRVVCAVLLLGLAVRHRLPAALKHFLPHYYIITITFCLPFFFSFMMFMNGWSTVWAMSFMASIFLHILLVHETRIMLIQAVGSLSLSFLFAYGFNDRLLDGGVPIVWPYIPIFLFTYIFGNLFYFRNQVEHESKVSIAKSFGAGIAHEMRNPLSALQTSVDVLSASLPSTKSDQEEAYELTRHDIERMNEVLSSADEVIRNGNETIDLLLTSIDENRVSHSTFKTHSIEQVVRDSLETYAYKGDKATKYITLNVGADFEYFGSDTLLKYALYNLLKNALYYRNSEEFRITITLDSDDTKNYLYFEDNGVGIEEDKLEHIFKDFYTSGKASSYGLGLPFCQRVMHAFGGEIECESVLGEWTHFSLMFPKAHSPQVTAIKQEIMRSRSILYIGSEPTIQRRLTEAVFYTGCEFTGETFAQSLEKEEYEFEYDLILIDLDSCSESDYLKLESKLHFTEAKLVVLYNRTRYYHNRFSRFLSIYAVEKSKLVGKAINVISEMMFGQEEADRSMIPSKPQIMGKTILIADDNESMRQLTSILLNKQGYQVSHASDGHEVLDVLSKESVDLILMDIEMPQLNGFEATEVIRHSRTDYSSIPIVGHTGDNSQETLKRIREVGMNDYLIKPVDKTHLLDKLSQHL
ncbi:hybrid sensor histidine kinase/response regulator [Vibrio aquaticus]|uniref:histidine kinase n=1 Tax=Vibrio aquaticus TaxID=2496559 RepID=A0A3S0V5C0_9VIBR|nr:hybrid sensor histidine kinase/response regulator [Vibrio aquaticus]RTZ18318.1 hybrid sensor histidine kinase/response regulator [Vibrio aquaticus]